MMTNAFPQFLQVLNCGVRPYQAKAEAEAETERAMESPGVGGVSGEAQGARGLEVGRAGAPPLLSVISTRPATRAIFVPNYSNKFNIIENKNNMQSVNFSLVLEYIDNFEHKGIANNYCLISDISLICVPKLIIRNYCYLDINSVKKPKEEVIEEVMTDTKNPGAFPRFWEPKSQSINKTVDNNCDFDIFVKCILINQIVGEAPNDSIPETKNAITVQGICNCIGRPHLRSFNPNLMFSGVNKSDYAFIHNTRIISNHSVLYESEAVSTPLELALGERENKSIETESNIITDPESVPGDSKLSALVDCQATRGDREKATSENEFTTFKNGDYTFASLLKMMEQAPASVSSLVEKGVAACNSWGIPAVLRLAGGGETSLNTPTGWGSPPSATNNNGNNSNWGNSGAAGPGGAANSAQQQWGANQRPPTSQSDGNSNKMGTSGVSGGGGGGAGGAAAPNSSSSVGGTTGGWGGVGAPPPPSSQPSAQPLAQGGNGGGSPGGGNGGGTGSGGGPGAGAPPATQPAPTAKTQLEQLNTMRESLFSLDGWGGQHVNQDTNWDVPNSPEPGVKMDQQGGPPMWKPNINNGTDLWEANLRNGGQPPPQPVAKTPWGHTPSNNIGGTWGEDDDTPESSNVWNGPPPPQQWGGGPPQQPPHWNAPAKKDDWGGWGEPHRPDLHRPDLHRAPAPDPRDMRGIMGDMRGDPRGISGRLNGSTDMWGQHHMPHGMQQQNKMMPANVGNGVNQWGAQGPKDIGMAKGASGWEEPSPPAARRNMPNFDDGTSLWGQQRGGSVGMGPWKEMAGGMGRGTMPCPPGMAPNRMPGVAPNPMKPDAMWGHPHRNGSWEDGSGHAANWEKDSISSWNEVPVNPGAAGWPGPKTKPMAGPGGSWDSDMGDWCGGPKPPVGGSSVKMLAKEAVWNSKQFRFLSDMGYKKEDVEQALRSRDMNAEEALDLLSQMRGGGGGIDTWRRHEDHPAGPPFEHQQQYPAPPRPHHAFPPQQQPNVPFPQPINNMSPALVQKILGQPTSQPPPPFNQQNNQSGGSGQPTTAQLRMLVQQIQMAVSAGYLNHQILNQPLAPQTLVLLNQLLQQIKVLQKQASQNNLMQSSMAGKTNSSAMLHISYQITKTKQQISNLQNQISAQQAIYVQQQAGASGGSTSGSAAGDFFNKPHDALGQLQNNFADISLHKDPPSSYGAGSGQQSRLNQWKLPSLDKEGEGSEFSRAPGTTSKPNTSPQLNPLALQPDNTWSTGRSVSDGWPSSDASDLPDGKEAWPSSQQHSTSSSTYTDLVPEFEPGKPWKGNQMKSIEDDPAITPGSVVRSPLSLAAIKEPDTVGGKASPTTPSERTLSSSTWSYPPPPASTPSGSLGLGKGELWGSKAGVGAAPGGRLPPTQGKGPAPSATAPWAAPAPPRSQPYPHQPSWPSTWLLLKNLTAQIDGSTLKTLCMQHGPLQSFHLYLNQGIALAKYSTREEANKAQTALNNCVLGNTTIFAESPAESDVSMILQHLGQGGGGVGGVGAQWRGSGGVGGAGGVQPAPAPGKDPWAFTSLWADTEQRSTPSSLSSFLPPDLLGGESM